MPLAGQRLEVSILFQDIRGFTALSEQLDPVALLRMLNQFFTEVVAAVEAEGALDTTRANRPAVARTRPHRRQDSRPQGAGYGTREKPYEDERGSVRGIMSVSARGSDTSVSANATLRRSGAIQHETVFFKGTGDPVQNLQDHLDPGDKAITGGERGIAAAIVAAAPSGPTLRVVQNRSRRFCRTRLFMFEGSNPRVVAC